MAIQLKFKFPISTLVKEGNYILTAAEAHSTDINPRLKAGFVAGLRTAHADLRDNKITGQSKAKADTGELTKEQNDALTLLEDLMSQARKSAGLAFKGHDVKLRNEFQVGRQGGLSLGDILQSARIIQASCAAAANAAALAENGWIAADTTALLAAINDLDTTDDTQEDSKGDSSGATDARNQAANDFYDGLLKVQNAANIQYPERNAANATVRAEFRLGLFPPKTGGGKQPPPAPPTPPTPPA